MCWVCQHLFTPTHLYFVVKLPDKIYLAKKTFSVKKEREKKEDFAFHALWPFGHLANGAFTNYVYKKKWVGCPKKFFVNVYEVENVNVGSLVGGQKMSKTCQRSLWTPSKIEDNELLLYRHKGTFILNAMHQPHNGVNYLLNSQSYFLFMVYF